jgi:hypothetical protein
MPLCVVVVFFLWWIDDHEQGSVVAIGGMTDAGDGKLCRTFLLLLPTRHFGRLAHRDEQSVGE